MYVSGEAPPHYALKLLGYPDPWSMKGGVVMFLEGGVHMKVETNIHNYLYIHQFTSIYDSIKAKLYIDNTCKSSRDAGRGFS